MKDTIETILLHEGHALVYSLLKRRRIDGSTVLDIGAGFGEGTILLQLLYPQSLVIPCEISEDRCDYMKKEGINEFVCCCDGTRLPFKSESMDLVVCDNVIEHVEKQEQLVTEMSRVCRSGGHMLTGSILKQGRVALGFYRNKYGRRALTPDHVREYGSREEFVGLFQDHFHILECLTASFPIYPLWQIYLLMTILRLIKFDPKFTRQKIRFLTKIRLPRPGYSYIYPLGSKR